MAVVRQGIKIGQANRELKDGTLKSCIRKVSLKIIEFHWFEKNKVDTIPSVFFFLTRRKWTRIRLFFRCLSNNIKTAIVEIACGSWEIIYLFARNPPRTSALCTTTRPAKFALNSIFAVKRRPVRVRTQSSSRTRRRLKYYLASVPPGFRQKRVAISVDASTNTRERR